MVGIQGSFKTIDSGKTWIAKWYIIADFTNLIIWMSFYAVALINENIAVMNTPAHTFMITVDGGETWINICRRMLRWSPYLVYYIKVLENLFGRSEWCIFIIRPRNKPT